jgi:hypothetical protein
LILIYVIKKGNNVYPFQRKGDKKRRQIKMSTPKSCMAVILKDYYMPLPIEY